MTAILLDPEPTCMICGQICEREEEVRTPLLELWCWCEDCQIDTFHPIEPEGDCARNDES